MLNDNHFTGKFPRFIGNLYGLKTLNLQRNQITELCHQLGELTTLEVLKVSFVAVVHSSHLIVPFKSATGSGTAGALWDVKLMK